MFLGGESANRDYGKYDIVMSDGTQPGPLKCIDYLIKFAFNF